MLLGVRVEEKGGGVVGWVWYGGVGDIVVSLGDGGGAWVYKRVFLILDTCLVMSTG